MQGLNDKVAKLGAAFESVHWAQRFYHYFSAKHNEETAEYLTSDEFLLELKAKTRSELPVFYREAAQKRFNRTNNAGSQEFRASLA